jgi:cell division protein ZapA
VKHPHNITVQILDKEYQVACPPEREAELMVSARYLDKQMRNIRDSGKVIGLERIAVMAALNISFELLQASEQSTGAAGSGEAVANMHRKLDDALGKLRQPGVG